MRLEAHREPPQGQEIEGLKTAPISFEKSILRQKKWNGKNKLTSKACWISFGIASYRELR